MALGHLTASFSTLSTAMKIGIAVTVLAVAGLLIGGTFSIVSGIKSRSYAKQKEQLEQENRQAWDGYWEAIGERNALRVQAQQLKLEADAYREVGAQRGANVAAIDTKIGAIREQHDEIQNSVGDCASVADCRKQLCEKYKAAGIRLKSCPD